MGKKVDIEAMIAASDQKNSMTDRAPLAPGFEEDTPAARAEGEKAPTVPTTDMSRVVVTIPPMDLEVAQATPAVEGRDIVRAEADLDNAAFDDKARTAGVLVPHVFETQPERAPEVAPESMTEVQVLAAQVKALTKRLEDFGAIPKEVETGPRVPVVTITKAGNKRTDW